jgi:hypothetical protein
LVNKRRDARVRALRFAKALLDALAQATPRFGRWRRNADRRSLVVGPGRCQRARACKGVRILQAD